MRTRTLPDGSKRYDVKYRSGGRYTHLEHAGTFKTRREASERKALVGDMLARGENPKVELRREPGKPLREMADDWLVSRRGVGERTRESYRGRIKIVLEAFGDMRSEEIVPADVIRWVGGLESRYSAGTVALYVAQLRMMLDYCGGPNAARDRRVELPRYVRREPSPPDAAVVEVMLRNLPERHRIPAVVLELTGARVSEGLSLEPADVDPGRIRIRREVAKGQRRGRFIPVPEYLTDVLADLLPLHVQRQALAQATRRAGGINPHALRHRRASLWYQQGVGPVELAQRLGHARPSMSLDVYVNVSPLEEIPAHVLRHFLTERDVL